MKKKQIAILGILILTCTLFSGCSGKNSEQKSADTSAASVTETTSVSEITSALELENEEKKEEEEAQESEKLPDGVYTADFDTDNAMFRVSEACNGKGTLTVKNGEMVIHVSLGSKNIVNLYPGLAEDAEKDGAELLSPTTDSVTYSDGLTE